MRTPSNASSARPDRADTPIPDFNANDDQPEYENEFNDKIDENEPEKLVSVITFPDVLCVLIRFGRIVTVTVTCYAKS